LFLLNSHGFLTFFDHISIVVGNFHQGLLLCTPSGVLNKASFAWFVSTCFNEKHQPEILSLSDWVF
jgi:hypothetical protein